MSFLASSRFVLVVAVLLCSVPWLRAQNDAPKKKPKFTVGRDTTYVTGPIDKDGYIDYATALNDRLREGVTPANNVNALLWTALGPQPDGSKMPEVFFANMKVPTPPEKGDYLVFLGQFSRERFKEDSNAAWNRLSDDLEAAAARPWTAKEYPDIADWLKRNDKPLAIVIEATKRPRYYYPLVPVGKDKQGWEGLMTSNMHGVQICRHLASMLAARAMVRTSEGRHDEAWQDLLAVHRLARHVGSGATLIEGLVGINLDTITASADLALIDHAKLSARQLKDRLRDLQALSPIPLMADKINLGERFLFLDSVMLIDRTGGDLGLDPALKAARTRAGVISWNTALKNANQWYTRMSLAMRLKDRAFREKQLYQLELDTRSLKQEITSARGYASAFLSTKPDEAVGKIIGDHLICLLIPAFMKVQHAGDRGEQIERNLHLAFALAAYKADEGRYPLKLDALAPKYLPEIPDDLFTGKALIYRPADNGYLLYSVGINGKDEGGRNWDDDPQGDDLVVRMPLPKLRERK